MKRSRVRTLSAFTLLYHVLAKKFKKTVDQIDWAIIDSETAFSTSKPKGITSIITQERLKTVLENPKEYLYNKYAKKLIEYTSRIEELYNKLKKKDFKRYQEDITNATNKILLTSKELNQIMLNYFPDSRFNIIPDVPYE